MACSLKVHNESGEKLAQLLAFTRSYVFKDGFRLSVDERVAWCAACNRFTLAEDLMSADDKRQEIAESFWQRYPDERTAFLLDALRWEQENAVSKRQRWYDYLASDRISPARCLECSSTDVAFLEERQNSEKWLAHPATAERVQVNVIRFSGTAATDIGGGPLYTPEGVCIR